MFVLTDYDIKCSQDNLSDFYHDPLLLSSEEDTIGEFDEVELKKILKFELALQAKFKEQGRSEEYLYRTHLYYFDDNINVMLNYNNITIYKNNIVHRDNDLPAIFSLNGKKKWWIRNGVYSRDDNKPTVEYTEDNGIGGYFEWLNEEKQKHNLSGPAYVNKKTGKEEFYIKDVLYSEMDYLIKVGKILSKMNK